jgi:hypothetical protein
MNTDPPKAERHGPRLRWSVLFLLVLLVAAAAVLFWFASREPAATPQAIVVQSTWSSNGEEYVTFRTQPPGSEVHFADIVPASDNDAPPATTTFSTGIADLDLPAVQGSPVRYVALPFSATIGGVPVACTPGSYTVAFTATSGVTQLRVGVAREAVGLWDWRERVRKAWKTKNLHYLVMSTHLKPVYVRSVPITNSTAVSQ